MREPKFSDAPCFGKEFDAGSKICRICLANKVCQRKYYRAFGAPEPTVMRAPPSSMRMIRFEPSSPTPRASERVLKIGGVLFSRQRPDGEARRRRISLVDLRLRSNEARGPLA